MKGLWAVVLAFLLAGCTSSVTKTGSILPFSLSPYSNLTSDPSLLVIIGNDEFKDDVLYWKIEIRKRFPTQKVVMFFGHGFGYTQGDWFITPDHKEKKEDMRVFARRLHDAYKDYIIVLISCNPGRSDLYVPNVYYAKESVWVRPDAFCTPHSLTPEEWAQNMTYSLTGMGKFTRETDKDSFSVGSIFEFYTEGRR